jgi:ABC-type branched-subunit amino acid transport system substrate-binding protein
MDVAYVMLPGGFRFRVATSMWEHADMPTSEETAAALRKAVRAKTAAEKRADDARAALAVAMAQAIQQGMKQSEVVSLTGYTREHVRRLVREVEEQQTSS